MRISFTKLILYHSDNISFSQIRTRKSIYRQLHDPQKDMSLEGGHLVEYNVQFHQP